MTANAVCRRGLSARVASSSRLAIVRLCFAPLPLPQTLLCQLNAIRVAELKVNAVVPGVSFVHAVAT